MAALQRLLSLRGALALNTMNMVGAGPFITLPLVAAALGSGAWLGWLAGALLAAADGLVWAELGAALPRAGGSYAYLREIYKPSEPSDFDYGRFFSFLYTWQLVFTASLSVTSGALGFAQYAAFLVPSLRHGFHLGLLTVQGTSLLAAAVCLLAVFLLSRGLGVIAQAAGWLAGGVLLTLGAVAAVGLTHLQAPLVAAQMHWPRGEGLAGALGAAMLITTYDYWGYYNVCFLGEETRDPGRTIPRAVLLSIAVVACLYLLMNFAVLGAVPIPSLLTETGAAEPMAAVLMRQVLPSGLGGLAGTLAAVFIMWTAFASIVSLLLGYSRAPYAAARDGNFFRPFAELHPRHGYPRTALLALSCLGAVFCFFDLRTVIASLVAVRIVLQYGLQQVGVIVLRFRRPGLARPFRMWLYPLPPLAALLGFGFLLLSRAHAGRELALAAGLGGSGALLYWRLNRRNGS